MADRLAESTWSSFTKKQALKLEDGALLKALARFDKTEDSKPGPRLEALEDLVGQIGKQVVALAKRKKELGDKPFALAKDKLYELLALAEEQQKRAQAAVAESSEEADSPVLLTTKMAPLVRELRKGDARMPALICTAGKDTAVLLMRRSIAASRRKLMSDFLGVQGGARYITGECVFEKAALTFVVASPAAGLAKRIRAALAGQLDMRLKVRVRGEDGAEDEDGEDGGDGPPGVTAQATQPPPGKPASAAALAYTQRLLKVQDRLSQALREQHPETTKLRAVSGFASEKAAAEDYLAATKALEMLDKLLDSRMTVGNGQAAGASGAVDAGAAFKARMTALIPRIKESQASGSAVAQDVKRKASEAGVLAGKKEFDRANALLDEATELLRTGAAEAAAPTGEAVVGAAAARASSDGAAPAARLGAAASEVNALKQQGAPEVQPLLKALQAAQAGIGGADAAALLDRLEELIALARSAARGRQAKAGNTRGIAWPKLLLRWRDAQSRSLGAVEELGRAILAMPEVQNDPRLDKVKLAVSMLPALIPDLGGTLGDLLDKGLNAGTDTGIAEQARRVAAEYRQRLIAATALSRLEQFAKTHVGELQVLRTLDDALAEIAQSLE